MESERNHWDRANQQGENMDPENSDEKFLKEDAEINPNKDADGYGSEAARSDHSHYDSGFGSRTGNNHESNYMSSRSREDLSSGNQGSSGRAHG